MFHRVSGSGFNIWYLTSYNLTGEFVEVFALRCYLHYAGVPAEAPKKISGVHKRCWRYIPKLKKLENNIDTSTIPKPEAQAAWSGSFHLKRFLSFYLREFSCVEFVQCFSSHYKSSFFSSQTTDPVNWMLFVFNLSAIPETLYKWKRYHLWFFLLLFMLVAALHFDTG